MNDYLKREERMEPFSSYQREYPWWIAVIAVAALIYVVLPL